MKTIVSERKIELLKKYFPLDEESKTFTIKIYYDKASDLLDYSIGELTHEMLSEEFLEKLSSTLEMLPFDYKADVILDIKDYDAYNEEMMLEKFNDLMEISSFMVVKDTKKKNFHAFLLTFIGIAILILNVFLGETEIIKEGVMASILNETVDIIATVFIWEAVGEVFLTPEEDSARLVTIAHYINSLSISHDGKVGAYESREGIIEKSKTDLIASNGRKNVLIITSVLLSYLGSLGIIQAISDACNKNLNNLQGGLGGYIVSLSLSVVLLLLGISGILLFTNKKTDKKIYIPFVLVSGVLALTSIIVSIILDVDVINTIGHIAGLVCIIIYFFAFHQKRKNKAK